MAVPAAEAHARRRECSALANRQENNKINLGRTGQGQHAMPCKMWYHHPINPNNIRTSCEPGLFYFPVPFVVGSSCRRSYHLRAHVSLFSSLSSANTNNAGFFPRHPFAVNYPHPFLPKSCSLLTESCKSVVVVSLLLSPLGPPKAAGPWQP
jgi:hypothetical protein